MALKSLKAQAALNLSILAAVPVAFCIAASLMGRAPALSYLSALLGAASCAIPQLAYSIAVHRHDSLKGSIGLAVYDGIYAIILKYMIMIFLFICILKFGKIDNLIFILSFVFSAICASVLQLCIFLRKDNY